MELASIDHGAAAALLHLGAVFTGYAVKGQKGKVVWMRCLDLPTDAMMANVEADSYVRVHPKPKRFPACSTTDWLKQVVHLDDEVLILSKPADLLCQRHESNGKEEIAACAAAGLGLTGLEVCHRLDQWTTGLLCLSRTKAANARFKLQLKDRSVMKTYKALHVGDMPLGQHMHYMHDGPFNAGAAVLSGGCLPQRGPRLLSSTPHEGWKQCLLEVLACTPADARALAWADAKIGAQQSKDGTIYESTVKLMTGRTHQIRAQFSALGRPLLGDIMYGPIKQILVGNTGIVCDPEVIQLVEQLPMLSGPIGLHAWRLQWDRPIPGTCGVRPETFTAAPPWNNKVD